jgi:tRNA-specific 2-thiouridylase
VVRAEAARRGLSVAQKPDSHDICFIPDGDTRGWLAERIELAEGEIKDVEGTVLGTHRGAQAFTVGQRKGLRIGTPAPDGKPRFVLEIRPKTNEVVVGPQELLAVDELRGIRPTWAGAPAPEAAELLRDRPAAGQASSSFPVLAQVRAHGEPVPARARLELVPGPDGAPVPELVVLLDAPLRGVAPGQSLVLYQGTRVLGQATIDRAHSLARPDVARRGPGREA